MSNSQACLDAGEQVSAPALKPRMQRLAYDQNQVTRAAPWRLVALACQRQPAHTAQDFGALDVWKFSHRTWLYMVVAVQGKDSPHCSTAQIQ